jgi:hypothetical protein
MTVAYQPFIRTDAQLNALVNSWFDLDKAYEESKHPRDTRGRWTKTGIEGEDTSQWYEPGRFSTAVGRVAARLVATAATVSEMLATISGAAILRTPAAVVIGASKLVTDFHSLQVHIANVGPEVDELSAATKIKLRNLRDHVQNIKDHLQRLRAEQAGDKRTAATIRRRIDLRTRAIRLRSRWTPPHTSPESSYE